MKWLSLSMACLLSACAGLETVDYRAANDLAYIDAPLVMTKSQACVTVFWRTPDEIRQDCGPHARACAILQVDRGLIYTEKPRSWNDAVRLGRLGHELAHVLDGTHP